MEFQELFNKIMNKKRGIIRLVNSYDSNSSTIAEPVCVDLLGNEELKIISATQKGELHVINENGTLHWKFKITENVNDVEKMFLDEELSSSINASPSIADINDDGKYELLFGTELGSIYCLSNSGKELWNYKTKGAIRGKIALYKDANNNTRIIFGSADKNIYELSDKGVLIQKIKTEYELESSPTLFSDLLVVGTRNGALLAFDTAGKKTWTFQTESKITAEPQILRVDKQEELLIVGSTDNHLYCINKEGKLVWKYKTGGSIYSKALITDLNDDGLPEIVFGSCDNHVYVLNDRGIKLWSYETDFWVVGSPLLMDLDFDNKKEIIIGSYDTNIYVLSAEGAYNVGYIPGISGIVAQDGNYSEIPTQEPGEIIGKKLWTLKTTGIIIGCCNAGDRIAVQTKEGKVLLIEHEDT